MLEQNLVTVVIPSKREPQLETAMASLEHLPFPYTVFISDGPGGWAKAVNEGIMMREEGGDVLLMDDDVELTSHTFHRFNEYYDKADIFGFKLLFQDGSIQHAGGHIAYTYMGHYGRGGHYRAFSRPMYVMHCTASLLYIKNHVFDRIGLMDVFPGMQFEDVDFSLRAINDGMSILYLPNIAYHHESLTKSKEGMKEKMDIALTHFRDKWKQSDVWEKLRGFPYEIQ